MPPHPIQEQWLPALVTLLSLTGFSHYHIVFTSAAAAPGAFVGFNVGTDHISNPAPSPTTTVTLLKSQNITHIRLLDANPQLLTALANTSISVTVTIPNQQLYSIGRSSSAAASWVNSNILTYIPDTNITSISVGNDVLTTIPHLTPVLQPAMNYIHNALVQANLNYKIKVSTPLSISVLSSPSPFPPSDATFNSTHNHTIYQILQFLDNTNSHFMLNAYPYQVYSTSHGIFPLQYALFEQQQQQPSSSRQPDQIIVDPNTLYQYHSLFDSMVDAVYYSMSALNFTNIPIIVTETGWPTNGGPIEPDATIDNAQKYNTNLIKRVLNNSGPPGRPTVPTSAYIYELYNQDLRRGPISQKNWGVFFPNGTAVYHDPFTVSSSTTSTSSSGGGVYCVAKMDADEDKLRDGLDWACGQGKANCKAIQQGHPCYQPNTVQNHASYAYNDYYQKMRSAGGTCDFDGTATLSNSNPSYGSCIFTASLNTSSSEGTMSAAFGPVVSPLLGESASMRISLPRAIISYYVILVFSLHLFNL